MLLLDIIGMMVNIRNIYEDSFNTLKFFLEIILSCYFIILVLFS